MTINKTLEKIAREKIRLLVRDIEDSDLVLVAGDKRSLLALGELLVAVASTADGHIQISPTMAGSRLFKKGSAKGFYIRCVEGNPKPLKNVMPPKLQ